MTETTALDKDKLLRTAMRHLSREMWERGDGDRYPWVWTELEAIEQAFDELTEDELVRRLRLLYKRIAAAKGRRGHVTHRVKLDGSSVAEDTGQNTHSSASANATASAERNPMPVFVDVPNETLVGRGEHRAKIVTIGKPEQSKFDETKKSVKLTFEITNGKHESERLTKFYTLSLTSKSSLGQLYRRLVRELKPGERVEIERELVGREVSIIVTHKEGDDGPYAVIEDVFAPDAASEAVKV